MITFARIRQLAAVASVLVATEGIAQQPIGFQRRQATREELEQAVGAAEQAAAVADPKTRERLSAHVSSLRQRLRVGDFVPGDRILLVVLGDSALTDTFTVRVDQQLKLPDLPEISLRGVLDSELQAFLRKEISRYLIDPKVTATGLIRLQLSGAIARPGFFTVPIDQVIADVFMVAGGPAQNAKLDGAYVRRSTDTFLDRRQLAEAIRLGKTVGDASLRDGDELVIPAAATGGRIGAMAPILGLVGTLIFVLSSRR